MYPFAISPARTLANTSFISLFSPGEKQNRNVTLVRRNLFTNSQTQPTCTHAVKRYRVENVTRDRLIPVSLPVECLTGMILLRDATVWAVVLGIGYIPSSFLCCGVLRPRATVLCRWHFFGRGVASLDYFRTSYNSIVWATQQ